MQTDSLKKTYGVKKDVELIEALVHHIGNLKVCVSAYTSTAEAWRNGFKELLESIEQKKAQDESK